MAKLISFLICFLLPYPGFTDQLLTLDQTLDFKWRGLPIATMSFKASLPIQDVQTTVSGLATPLFEPTTLIEITGETRGALRLVEDYQAVVSYVQLDANGKNAMTLVGQDNGEPEHREIIFAPRSMPEVRLFEDSTADNALKPQAGWAADTTNPLHVFKMMLESTVLGSECATQTWGYDGKRRYLLKLESSGGAPSLDHQLISNAVAGDETTQRHVCKITMYAEGRQSADSHGAKPSIIASRLASLWPFGDGDRELLFDFDVSVNPGDVRGLKLMINEIRVATPLGAIVARE
jgi:hypothetical protein